MGGSKLLERLYTPEIKELSGLCYRIFQRLELFESPYKKRKETPAIVELL
jgi:hypothetical protein